MSELQGARPFDLEERTELFAKDIRELLRRIPRTISHEEDGRQLIKSSGSVAANYIEAPEALSKKDFRMRVRIARKEAKESGLWLRLLHPDGNLQLIERRDQLNQETYELIKIFTAIIKKSDG